MKKLFPFLVYLLIYFILLFPYPASIIPYSIVYISTSVIFIFLCYYIFKVEFTRKQFHFLILSAFLLRIFVLFVQPTGSDDFYRYLWDGKVLANGINPYQYAPADSGLNHLHSDLLPGSVTYPEIKTIYPPMAQALFFLAYSVGGESHWGIKLLLFLFELLTAAGIFLILKKLKLQEKYIFIYILAPLPVFQILIDAHLDGFGLPLIIFSIYFYLEQKNILSLLLLGLSVCVKPVGLLLIPIMFFNEKDIRKKLQIIIIPVITCLFLYFPFLVTASPEVVFQTLGNFSAKWSFNGFVFEILNSIINNSPLSRIICAILFLIVFILIIFSKKDFLNKVYFSFFILFIFSPIVHPWYLVWLAVLLPFIFRWSGIIYTTLASLTVITVLNYQLFGEWENYPAVLVIEYAPTLIFFLYEIFSTAYSGNRLQVKESAKF